MAMAYYTPWPFLLNAFGIAITEREAPNYEAQNPKSSIHLPPSNKRLLMQHAPQKPL
jgi:hypothetical protein